MRTAIQNKIMLLCSTGTFPVVGHRKSLILEASKEAPEAIRGARIWHTTGTTENGKKVYYDPTDTWAYWNHPTDGMIVTVVGDVGGSPVDCFKEQRYPETFEASGAGNSSYNGVWSTYDGYYDRWRIEIEDLTRESLPKTGWTAYGGGISPAFTLEYALPTGLQGFGSLSGSITVGNKMQEAYIKEGETSTPAVVVGEISGNLTKSVRAGGRTGKPSMENWQFEARLKFNQEVSVDYFLKNELKVISFVFDNELVRVTSTGFPVSQPPRQQPHNGTEMVITFSVNTRR